MTLSCRDPGVRRGYQGDARGTRLGQADDDVVASRARAKGMRDPMKLVDEICPRHASDIQGVDGFDDVPTALIRQARQSSSTAFVIRIHFERI